MFEFLTVTTIPVYQGIFPIIALAAAAIGTGLQTFSAIRSQQEARTAERSRRGAEELQAQRERLQAVREARIRRAEVAAAAEAQGAAGSTGEQGAQASIGTQLQSNLGFISSQSRAAGQISRATLRGNRAQLIGGLGGSIAGLGSSIADFGFRQQQNRAQERQATRVPLPGQE